MRKTLKRFLSASVAVVILVTTAATNVYAATPSEGNGDTYTPGSYPGNGINPLPVGNHGGVRITITNMARLAILVIVVTCWYGMCTIQDGAPHGLSVT